ncbi:MAG: carboxypeptidase-like regulatory domain-containing protein [Mariniphaga sp.]
MKRYLVLILAIFLAQSISAQTETGIAHTVKGIVINEETNEIISFTNIGIENTFYGTASDEKGNFQLKIPQEMATGDIYFSAIGYKNKKFPVAGLFTREFNIIKLEPQSYDIQDIDIAAQSKVLIRILRMASENTPYNYLGGPFNMIGELQHEKIVNDTTRITENAEIWIFDKTGYRHPSKTDAFQMRNYQIKKNEPDYSFSTGFLNFDEILELDWVRSSSSVLNPDLLDQFELKQINQQDTERESDWVIAFSQSKPTPEGSQDFHATTFQGEITINKEDYAVKKIVGSAESAIQNRQGKSLAVGAGNTNYFENVTYHFEVTFSQLKPEAMLLNKTYLFNGHKIEEKSKLTITRIEMTNVKEIASRDYFVE